MNATEYLAAYDIDMHYGFLPSTPPLQQLPAEFEVWDDIAQQFSGLLNAQAFRSIANKMPVIATEGLQTRAELERAMLLLSCFGHGYVWEGYSSSGYLPQSIAVPWVQVASRLDRQPALAHASLVLQNWALIDEEGPIALGNIRTLIQFHGGIDEAWFYLVTTAIEAVGANILSALATCKVAIKHQEHQQVKAAMDIILLHLVELVNTLNRMYEHCDPYIFHTRVRPFLASLKHIEYQGCANNPRNYFGGSAAQSSLLQAIDGAFGIKHEEEHARFYLREMRKYMPKQHARFVFDVETENLLGNYVAQHSDLQPVYDDCISALVDFRQLHLEQVARYIMAQTPKNGPGHTGTGGTNPMVFLKQVKQDTQVN